MHKVVSHTSRAQDHLVVMVKVTGIIPMILVCVLKKKRYKELFWENV